MTVLASVLDQIDRELDTALVRLSDLIAIESISTDPAHDAQCQHAAKLLATDLSDIGFDAAVHPTTGQPMVVGHHDGPPGTPHVLFYGHYDVQPVDPLELWERAPFEAAIIDGTDGNKIIHGRGSSDDKGQLMTFVEACRAWKAQTGALPCRVSILFEGEEESGSPSLHPFLHANKQELTADYALVCDTGMWDAETPAIATSLRGLTGEEVVIHAAERDLHSGLYGSAAANPIRILSRILAAMHDEDGRVTLTGFYDGVEEVPRQTRDQWASLGFSAETFLGAVGLSQPAGEKGYTALEQTWARPTAEINGIIGGYTDEGFKTVIPAIASAKVSFRLVGNQNPDKVRQAFRDHVRSMLPVDCTAEFTEHGASPAIVLDPHMPALKIAAGALKDEWGKETALTAMGGSIPIVGDFQTILGMESLLVGFALDDDRIHSPNEKYNLNSFHKGTRSWARILAALGAAT